MAIWDQLPGGNEDASGRSPWSDLVLFAACLISIIALRLSLYHAPGAESLRKMLDKSNKRLKQGWRDHRSVAHIVQTHQSALESRVFPSNPNDLLGTLREFLVGLTNWWVSNIFRATREVGPSSHGSRLLPSIPKTLIYSRDIVVALAQSAAARLTKPISPEKPTGQELVFTGPPSDQEPDTTIRRRSSHRESEICTSPSLSRAFYVSLVQRRPESVPITVTHPHAARRAARAWCTGFEGRTIYAVKANPCPLLLTTLYENGIRWFDVASLNEICQVSHTFPDATLCFMNPVKPEDSIRDAYWIHGVRVFSLDSTEELAKIQRATKNMDGRTATDLTLCVRLSVTSRHAKLSLGPKFGVHGQCARDLLVSTRKVAAKLGICFHVGTQCMNPEDYRVALRDVHRILTVVDVKIDIIDVGGGFPVVYPGMYPPSITSYFDSICQSSVELHIKDMGIELWAEPGRALCADYNSLIVRVVARRGTNLYINDGAYGTLSDAARLKWRYSVTLLRQGNTGVERSSRLDYSFYGPTCDGLDYMPGPFSLPNDVEVGDCIRIDGVGAYGCTMRTAFNGFDTYETVNLPDDH